MTQTVGASRPLRLLLILEDESLGRQAQDVLRVHLPQAEITSAGDRASFEHALQTGAFDVVVAGDTLSWSPSVAIVHTCKARWPHSPVLVLGEASSIEEAVETMKAGASDYLAFPAAGGPRLVEAITESLQRAREHAALEHPYRDFFERLPIGLYRTSPDGRILDANSALADLLGLPDVSSLLSSDATRFYVDPKQRTQWRVLATRDGLVRDFDFQLRRADGQVIWARDTGRLVRDSAGRVVCYEGALIDVTDRRRAQQALQESEALYRQLFETMLNGAAMHEILLDDEGRPVDYRFLQVNPAFEALTGLRASDILGKTARQVLPGLEPIWIERYGQVALTGKPIRFTEYSRDLQKHFDVAAFSPHPGRFAAIFSDITAQVEAHEQLTRERDFLQRVMETSPAGIVFVDRQGQITFANRQAEAVLGLQASQIRGRHYNAPEWQITDFDGRPFPDEQLPFRQVLETGKPVFDVQHAIAGPDGQRVLLSINAAPIFDPAGEVDGMVATVEDITGPFLTEHAARRTRAMLEAVSEAAQEFLRNPSWETVLPLVLARLGTTVDVSRVYLFENHLDDAGRAVTRQRFEWTAEGVTPQIDNPALQNFPWEEGGFTRWQQELGAGRPIAGLVSQMPEFERLVLEAQQIRSIVVVPVFVSGHWWGFLGFDECSRERQWSPEEVDTLMAAANALGLAIERRATEQSLERRLAELGELYQTSLEITGQEPISDLLRSIVSRAVDLTGTTVGGLYLTRPDGQSLELVVGHHLPGSLVGCVLQAGEGLSGKVLQAGQALTVEDYRRWSGRSPLYEGLALGRSLAVPLKVGSRVIGVISVTEDRPGGFAPEDIGLVSMFADQAAIALETARLLEEVQRRAAHLEAITGVASALRTAASRAEMMPIILDEVQRLMTTEAAGIFSYDEREQQAWLESACGLWSPQVGLALRPEVCSVLPSGKPYVATDTTQEPQLAGHPLVGSVKALALLPLVAQRKPLGCLAVGRAKAFSEEEIRLLVAVAEMASNALHRAGVMETLEVRVAERTRELAEANERLQELDRLKSDFVANVSHELRAPIANILLYLDLISGPIPASRHASYVGILKGEAERLNRLIEDLLTLSRIERGVLPLEAEPHPVDPLVAEVVAALHPRAAVKGQSLIHEPNHRRPAALINRMQISQVLTNLIGNAIAYAPQGARIEVSCREEQVSGREYVGLRVHNDGPPIDAEDLPHLFERFYRGRNARLSGEPGTGLGLAICREIVERHHGWIDVESSEDSGTSFTVWVPAARQGG